MNTNVTNNNNFKNEFKTFDELSAYKTFIRQCYDDFSIDDGMPSKYEYIKNFKRHSKNW